MGIPTSLPVKKEYKQTTLDTFFVPASEIGVTDWALMEARLDRAARKYDSKFRNFPRGKSLTKYIFDTIKKFAGITTKELIRVLELPKSTVYDHVKYLIEEKHSVRKENGKLYCVGDPPRVLVDWCYHNITVLFLVQHEVGVLNELCGYLNKTDLLKACERKATVWPPKRNWRPIQKSRSIKVACTKDPLNFEEMKILRSLIWEFFKAKKRLRFNLERNIDVEDSNPRKIYIPNTTISEEGRFIRQYLKRINNKAIVRTEVLREGEFKDVITELEEKLEKEDLWDRLRSKDAVIEELRKKNYKRVLEIQRLEKENQTLKKKLLEIEDD